MVGLPNQDPGVPYPQSQASRRSDRSDSSLPGSQDPYTDGRYLPPTPYSSGGVNPSYTPTAGFQPPPNYPTQQIGGYPQSGYAPVSGGYQQNPTYPPVSVYQQTGSLYPSSSGYSAPGYPAPVGRTANPNDQNYTYDSGEYSNLGFQYRQQGGYSTGAPPRDPRADPRTADPRTAANYPYVSSPQETTMRGTALDERYGYAQTIPTVQAGRGAFPTPARGTPTGYDPPPPRDGFDRETERRRR